MSNEKPKVYFSKIITPEKLVDLYKALGKTLPGNVAIKVHSGTRGNINWIHPPFFKPIIDHVGGTVVECNTAFPGDRGTLENHKKLLDEFGWTKLYNKVEILDGEGEEIVPIENGLHLKEARIGTKMRNYDSTLVLSHFKGVGCGFGGALKQLSIGYASGSGKVIQHCGGKTANYTEMRNCHCDGDTMKKSMADCANVVVKHFREKGDLAFISLLMNISVKCDCFKDSPPPCMKDIGVLASSDPVAIDQACMDLVRKSDDPGKKEMVNLFDEKNAKFMIECAEKLGIGKKDYDLVEID